MDERLRILRRRAFSTNDSSDYISYIAALERVCYSEKESLGPYYLVIISAGSRQPLDSHCVILEDSWPTHWGLFGTTHEALVFIITTLRTWLLPEGVDTTEFDDMCTAAVREMEQYLEDDDFQICEVIENWNTNEGIRAGSYMGGGLFDFPPFVNVFLI